MAEEVPDATGTVFKIVATLSAGAISGALLEAAHHRPGDKVNWRALLTEKALLGALVAAYGLLAGHAAHEVYHRHRKRPAKPAIRVSASQREGRAGEQRNRHRA